MITSDSEAWVNYPFHRNWFNKLWVAEKFNYICGPNAVSVPKTGEYVIRPIYNLHGMGAGAQIVSITQGDLDAVPPGYFWCEKFTGKQLSIELKWVNTQWTITSVYEGEKDSKELFRFTRWKKVDEEVIIPQCLNELWDCEYINVEMIGNKVIEVHLRGSPDPLNFNEIIPVWSDTYRDTRKLYKNTHRFIESVDKVQGTNISRYGFYCK